MSKKFSIVFSIVFCILSMVISAQNDFKAESFKKSVNPIVSSIAGHSVNIKHSAHVLSIQNTSENYLSQLNLPKAYRFLKQKFDTGSTNQNISFWIIDVIYMSEDAAKQAFSNLRALSGKVDGKFDQLSGLTYFNDYLVRDKNRILWLNTSCLYSKENQQQIVKYFKKNLKHEISESIQCNCGEMQCEYSGSL